MTTDTRLPAGPVTNLIAMRNFANEPERRMMQQRMETGWSHIRPNSVLVYGMGHHWWPGSWEKVVDMVMRTNESGLYCAFQEGQDRCLDWGDALGTMRNEAILQAQNEGFDWLCYLDNDVLPEPDFLVRLISWDVPVVAPYVVEPGTGMPLHGPRYLPNTGLKPGKWSVLSMLLFRTRVFNCFPAATFWSDAHGADEGFHFQRLWYYGHRLWLDTNVQLVVQRRPAYPLAINRVEEGETLDQYVARRQRFWGERLMKLAQPPDRRPVTPGKVTTPAGEYFPFALQFQQAPVGTLRAEPVSRPEDERVTVPSSLSNELEPWRP